MKFDMSAAWNEAVRLIYQNNDLLYVNINSLHKISKYAGKDTKPPRINKLGSDAWENLKRKTKKKVKDIAKDLIALYAKRKAQVGFAFTPDTYLQNELEASFIYEDTPDQLKATNDVKEDMERPQPMDRLVCGDVGFGKTEVAIRAAFKAVTDGKQVAVLAPTTILAEQHLHTFRERLADYPVRIEAISRFRTAKEQEAILADVLAGEVDVLIGTHRLLEADVQFHNLGLLIVDEEQRFGVKQKERFKDLKRQIDVLESGGEEDIRAMKPAELPARFVSHLSRRGLSKTSIARKLSFLKTFFKYLMKERFVDEGALPMAFHRPKLGKRLPAFLSRAEVDRLLASIARQPESPLRARNLAIIHVLFSSGIRVGELVRLDMEHLGMEQCELRVYGKGARERISFISKTALAALVDYLNTWPELAGRAPGPSDPLFLNADGGRLTVRSVGRMLDATGEEAGMEKSLHPHIFRHSFATHLLNNGVDLRVVQELLGHASIRSTQVYTHLGTERLRAAYLKAHPRVAQQQDSGGLH